MSNGETFKLGDIVPQNCKDAEVYVRTVDSVGKVVDNYIYYVTEAYRGWWNAYDDSIDCNNVELPIGQGLNIQGVDGASLRSSGTVCTNDILIKIRGGETLTGNPFPKTIKLGDIVPQNCNDAEVYVRTVDSVGKVVDNYIYYVTEAYRGWWNAYDDSIDCNDVEIPAGLGINIQGVDGASVYIASPID